MLDRRAEVPIGVQLAWALRARIQDGRLAPGQRLPGLRDLAQALEVNANTVRAVYQRLEREGLIESQQGSGTFVAGTSGKPSAAGAIAASVAREAQQLGVDPREVAAALYVEPARGSGGRSRNREAERRRSLREQIATLEQILVKIEADHPRVVRASRAAVPALHDTRPGRGPRLLEVDELERIQTHLIRRLAALQAAVDGRGEEGRPPPATTQQKAKEQRRAKPPRTSSRPAPAGA